MDEIDAQDLFTFSGKATLYNFDAASPLTLIERPNFNIANYDQYDKELAPYTPECFTYSTPIDIDVSPTIQEVISVARTMLSYINMVCVADLTKVDASLVELNKRAIEVIIYRVAYNPVGLRLLKRIINQLIKKQQKITFNISGRDFGCKYLEITIPKIDFDGKKAIRNDNKSFCFAKREEQYVLSEHERPFYIGLVHELIHLMHDLEGRRNGTVKNPFSKAIDDFGGPELWGSDDDLHVIWGVCAIQGRKLEYDNVSELTFRIADNIPIRMFYEADAVVGDGTTLDKYAYQHFEDYGQTLLNEFGEDYDIIDAVGKIKTIMTSIEINRISIRYL